MYYLSSVVLPWVGPACLSFFENVLAYLYSKTKELPPGQMIPDERFESNALLSTAPEQPATGAALGFINLSELYHVYFNQ